MNRVVEGGPIFWDLGNVLPMSYGWMVFFKDKIVAVVVQDIKLPQSSGLGAAVVFIEKVALTIL